MFSGTSREVFWLCVGFLGQGVFTARFLVQWLASERKRESVVPLSFWYLSLCGSWLLLVYAIYRLDPVIITGQALGAIVYGRNLILIYRKRRLAPQPTEAPAVLPIATAERPESVPLRQAG